VWPAHATGRPNSIARSGALEMIRMSFSTPGAESSRKLCVVGIVLSESFQDPRFGRLRPWVDQRTIAVVSANT
jgi:hypothetical protein